MIGEVGHQAVKRCYLLSSWKCSAQPLPSNSRVAMDNQEEDTEKLLICIANKCPTVCIYFLSMHSSHVNFPVPMDFILKGASMFTNTCE